MSIHLIICNDKADNMSISTIMKNVLSFGEILSQSCGKDAENWGSQSFQNAVKWAAYCEQICQQAEEKECYLALDKHVRSLGIYLKPATCMELSGEMLKSATQILRRNLLQNPYITDQLFEEVMGLYTSEDTSLSSLITECSDIASNKAMAQTANLIRKIMHPTPEIHQGRSLAVCQGEQLLKHLIQQLKMHSDHRRRFQEYITRLCEQLVSDPNGWDVILSLVLSDPGDSISEVSHVKSLVTSWIISSKSRPHPSQASNSQSFVCLASYWSQLLSSPTVGASARERLRELASRDDDPNIWRDVHKKVHLDKENEA